MEKESIMLRRFVCTSMLVGLFVVPAFAQDPAAATPPEGPAAEQAAEQAAPKIAVVNGDRIIVESALGQAAQTRAQQITSTWETRVTAKRDELDALVARRQNELETLTTTTLAALNAEIDLKQVELTRLQEDANRELGRSGQQAQVDIGQQLMSALALVAQQDGYDLILDTRTQGILFASEAIDVTDRVLAVMNAAGGS
jgi:Skp family chaperone for outer membrane proteins